MGNENCACCAPADPEEEQKIETAGRGNRGQTAVVEPPPPATTGVSGATSAPKSKPKPAAQPKNAVSFELMISDLDGMEQLAYGEFFQTCCGSGMTSCPIDNVTVRRFVIDNTSIIEDDLDVELIKVAPELDLDQAGFMQVMRDNAVTEAEAIEQFLQMGGEATSVPAEETRTRLRLFSQSKLGASFSEEQWQQVIDKVMSDAGLQVSMEQWCRYCKDTARMVRLAKYKQL